MELPPIVDEEVWQRSHEELLATSGSVFSLGAGSVVEGSERVRVELQGFLPIAGEAVDRAAGNLLDAGH